MTKYFMTDNQCRSRQLLHYFGEDIAEECGQCDVCLARKKEEKADREKAEKEIIDLLKDKQPHFVKELHTLQLPYESIEKALMKLVYEAIIIDDDGMLSLRT